MPKARKAEELRDQFLQDLKQKIVYWDSLDNRTSKEKLEGLAFSILCCFDGVSAGMPAIDLVMRPHPDDKQYRIDQDEDWIEDGTVINEGLYLHDMWYK